MSISVYAKERRRPAEVPRERSFYHCRTPSNVSNVKRIGEESAARPATLHFVAAGRVKLIYV
jgi:hypothetical protein